MNTKDNKQSLAILTKDDNKDTIPNRLLFVKTLLNGNSLQPIIDLDNTLTENFIKKQNDTESDGSCDTRSTLKKKVYDMTKIINDIGGNLQYIKSGSTGHTFKGEYKNDAGEIVYDYAVKVVAYSIKDKYGSMYDIRRPENAELMMIKLLSYFIVKKRTPHIVLPIGTFDTDINNFTNLLDLDYIDKSKNIDKYKEFIERYKNGEYYNNVSILISEWANRGDLNDFIKKNYSNFTLLHWKVIFFQIISTLAVIQSKFPTFRHNDLKANNILITKISNSNKSYTYMVDGNSYIIPNIGYQIKLWDFDFACIPGIVDNKKVMISNKWTRSINIGPTQNRYYDIHYFFNTLIKKGFFPELMTSSKIPDEVKSFVLSIVPREYQSGDVVAKGGRILHNNEYTTPATILKQNTFFKEFKTETKTRHTKVQVNELLKISDKPVIHKTFSRGGSKTNSKTRKTSKTNKTSKTRIRRNSKSKQKLLENVDITQLFLGQ
jgi:hypothetical protein